LRMSVGADCSVVIGHRLGLYRAHRLSQLIRA